MNVKEIKEFTNTLYDLLKKEKLPRRNIKRILYDRGNKLGIKENTIDVIWNGFIEDTYDPYGKNFTLKKKSKENYIVMKGKKSPIIVVNKNTGIREEFDSQAEAARFIKTTPSNLHKLLNEGKDFKEYSVLFKNRIATVVRKPIVIKTPTTKGIEDGPSSFQRAGDPSEDNPIISDVKPGIEPPKQSPPLEHNLDDARQAYIEALLDKAQKLILKYGIQLEEQEKKLFEDILK